jgi:glycogen debranching enzyme
MSQEHLIDVSRQTLIDNSDEEGVKASDSAEIYGCTFGRDGSIVSYKIVRYCQRIHDPQLLKVSRNTLLTLSSLEGTEFNSECGEQPGKGIHERRKNGFSHLINPQNPSIDKPWCTHPRLNGIASYDSVDSTALELLADYAYQDLTRQEDPEFRRLVQPRVERGLKWLMNYGDLDNDGLIEYPSVADRKSGGLVVQNWTDSKEWILDKDGHFPTYPIASPDVQAYSWKALRQWADYFKDHRSNEVSAEELEKRAAKMKEAFNASFIYEDQGRAYVAQALDGQKNQIKVVTSLPLHLFWAAYQRDPGDQPETILDNQYWDDVVERAFKGDLFKSDSGIKVMSELSPTHNPTESSYHNGSIWPHDVAIAEEGLRLCGYSNKADAAKNALLVPLNQRFPYPIEQFYRIGPNEWGMYRSESGQTSCLRQSFSAAGLLDMLTDENICLYQNPRILKAVA